MRRPPDESCAIVSPSTTTTIWPFEDEEDDEAEAGEEEKEEGELRHEEHDDWEKRGRLRHKSGDSRGRSNSASSSTSSSSSSSSSASSDWSSSSESERQSQNGNNRINDHRHHHPYLVSPSRHRYADRIVPFVEGIRDGRSSNSIHQPPPPPNRHCEAQDEQRTRHRDWREERRHQRPIVSRRLPMVVPDNLCGGWTTNEKAPSSKRHPLAPGDPLLGTDPRGKRDLLPLPPCRPVLFRIDDSWRGEMPPRRVLLRLEGDCLTRPQLLGWIETNVSGDCARAVTEVVMHQEGPSRVAWSIEFARAQDALDLVRFMWRRLLAYSGHDQKDLSDLSTMARESCQFDREGSKFDQLKCPPKAAEASSHGGSLSCDPRVPCICIDYDPLVVDRNTPSAQIIDSFRRHGIHPSSVERGKSRWHVHLADLGLVAWVYERRGTFTTADGRRLRPYPLEMTSELRRILDGRQVVLRDEKRRPEWRGESIRRDQRDHGEYGEEYHQHHYYYHQHQHQHHQQHRQSFNQPLYEPDAARTSRSSGDALGSLYQRRPLEPTSERIRKDTKDDTRNVGEGIIKERKQQWHPTSQEGNVGEEIIKERLQQRHPTSQEGNVGEEIIKEKKQQMHPESQEALVEPLLPEETDIPADTSKREVSFEDANKQPERKKAKKERKVDFTKIDATNNEVNQTPSIEPQEEYAHANSVTGSARTNGYFKPAQKINTIWTSKDGTSATLPWSFGSMGKTASSTNLPEAAAGSGSGGGGGGGEEKSSRSSRLSNRKSLAALTTTSTTANSLTLSFSAFQSRKKQLYLMRSSIHSWGLFAGSEPIDPGDMVIEYVGELVRLSVANLRERRLEERAAAKADGNAMIACSYLFRLDEHWVIDATNKGNLARFINHSCEPNCVARILQIDGERRILMYAKRAIAPGEEITYDYKFPRERDPARRVRCLCGHPSCRGYLN